MDAKPQSFENQSSMRKNSLAQNSDNVRNMRIDVPRNEANKEEKHQ